MTKIRNVIDRKVLEVILIDSKTSKAKMKSVLDNFFKDRTEYELTNKNRYDFEARLQEAGVSQNKMFRISLNDGLPRKYYEKRYNEIHGITSVESSSRGVGNSTTSGTGK